jgi:hypothetical protein
MDNNRELWMALAFFAAGIACLILVFLASN